MIALRISFFCIVFLVFNHYSNAQWTQLHAPGNSGVTSLHQFGGQLVLFSFDSHDFPLYHSQDEGKHWELVPMPVYNLSATPRFGHDSTYLYLFLPNYGLFRTSDWGFNWENIAPPQPGPSIPTTDDMAIADGFFYYNIVGGVFRLELNVDTLAQEVLSTQVQYPDMVLLRVRGKDVWASATDSLLRSSDHGVTWNLVWEGEKIKDFELAGDTLLLKTATGYWRSDHYGVDWNFVSSFNFGDNLSYSDGTWFTSKEYTPGVYRSTDAGLNWQVMFDSAGIYNSFSTQKKNGNRIAMNGGYGPVISYDNGSTWSYQCNGLKYTYSNTQPDFRLLDKTLWLNEHFSTDNGASWSFPIYDDNFSQYAFFTICAFDGSIYGINRKFELQRFDSDLTNRTLLPLQMPQNSIIYFITTDTNLYLALPDGIYETLDDGLNWTFKGFPVNGKITGHKHALYHLGNLNGVQTLFKSTDGGASWNATTANLTPNSLIQNARIVSTGQMMYIYGNNVILASEDDGESFKQVNTNLLEDVSGFPLAISAFAATDSMIAISNYQGFYFSPNSLSDQWISLYDGVPYSNTPPLFTAPLFVGDTLFIAGKDGRNQLWKRAVNSIKTFSGTVYFDQNNNGIKEPDEPPAPRATLYRSQDKFSMTGIDGQYALSIESAGDTLRMVSPSPHAIINPPFYLVQQEATGQDFGIYLPTDIADSRISLTPEGPFRPGFSNRIFIHCANLGGDTTQAKIRLFTAPTLNITSTNPAVSGSIGDTLFWNLPALAPLTNSVIEINVLLQPNTILGSKISAIATVETTGDIDSGNNSDTINEIVVGSFDPNDKTCLNGDYITPDEAIARNPLEYIVRFQNTGTYYAEIVRVSDQLEDYLDPTTFEFIGASHPCQVSIREGGKLEFLFTGINLPPTSQNEPESHGFVRFRVRPIANLALGDSIHNQASIYFDYNAPIITNTVHTVVNKLSATNQPASPPFIQILPNPASGRVRIESKPGEYTQLQVLDNLGRPLYTISHPNFPLTLEVSNYPKGVYWVMLIQTGGNVFFEKFVVN